MPIKQFVIPCLLFACVFTACIDDANQASANGQQSNTASMEPGALTSVKWIDSVRNMGSIREGQKLEVVFRFSNTGNKPLVIQNVQAACGCTVPSKPEAPIMPGAEGSIKAVFDSQGRVGANHKTITVTTNTEGVQNHVLEFNVEVVGAKDGPKPTQSPAG